ncbi:MAG: esterase family protein [Chloroflexi bacterium]|nr:esterase family protein [Chloroflexota bacterium]
MKREYHRWHSPALNRDMEMLVFGHAGARVLVFPTSRGKFYEWEDRGMIAALRPQLENGHLHIFCIDSIDSESWYNWWAHPGGRAYRHAQYDGCLYNEVLPFMLERNDNPYLITMGASFGAYHAMTFGLKHPDAVNRILAFSGLYDIRGFTGGYSDDYVFFNNPMQFIAAEYDHQRLSLMRRQDIIMATGREDRLIQQARDFSALLWNKGIGNALREWDGWAHDWPFWQQMMLLYISGHD